MTRRFAVLAVTLLLTLAVAVPAGAADAGVGTAETSVTLADLSLDGVGSVTLGDVLSYASIDSDTVLNDRGNGLPFAVSSVTLPVVGEVSARSDGDTGHPGQTVGVPGLATVTAGQLQATATDTSADSLIQALSGDVTAVLAGLRASVPAAGVSSVVDSAEGAVATNGAVLENVHVDVGDILPVDLLAQLPLGTLLALLDSLPVDLPADVAGLVNQLRDTVDTLGAIDTVQGEIDATQEELDSLAEDLEAAEDDLAEAAAEVIAAADAVTGTVCDVVVPVGTNLIDSVDQALGDAGTTVTDTTGEVVDAVDDTTDTVEDTADDILPLDHDSCHTLQQSVDELVDAQEAVDTLNTLIDQAQDLIDDLVETLNNLLDQLLALVEGLDLAALLAGLVDGLAAGELLAIDQLLVGVSAAADHNGSSASAICDATGVRVLGQARPIETCDQLQDALADVEAAIEDLLAGLPIVGSVGGDGISLSGVLPGGIVTVDGLSISTTPDNLQAGDYYVANASVQALVMDVQSVTLTQVADSVLAEVTVLVDGLVADLNDLTGLGVDTSGVQATVDGLVDALSTLPTGDLLGGVATPGLSLAALGVTSDAMFSPTGTPTPLPAAPPTGSTPIGNTPTGSTPLPATGGGLGLALVLMAAGGATWLARRGSKEGTPTG